MPTHSRRMRMAKRRHTGGHKKKGMSSRHGKKQHHKKAHAKKHTSRHKSAHRSGRSGAAGKAGRRMDHYHMRRRYLHAGLAGGILGAGMYDEDMEGNPFLEDGFLDDGGFLDDIMDAPFYHYKITTEPRIIIGRTAPHTVEQPGSESEEDSDYIDEGSESENDSVMDDAVLEGPPPLESEDHYHVFIYHSSNHEDQDQMDHYMQILESSPNDLKVMTSEKDFKSDLTTTQNLMLAMGLSQKIVLLCTQDFIDTDLNNFTSTVTRVLNEVERSVKVVVVAGPDVELPDSMKNYKNHFSLSDPDCFEKLTRHLMTGPSKDPFHVHKNGTAGGHPEPSAPSPNGSISPLDMKLNEAKPDPPPKEPTTNYANGQVIKQVTANKYSSFEPQKDEEKGLIESYCPRSDMLCPRPDPEYRLPSALHKRGLQMTLDEFNEILESLSEASKVTFFQKSVDCSLPCLFLSCILVVTFISCSTWFLVTGYLSKAAVSALGGSMFWSFMVLVVFIPSVSALIILGVVMHLVNYKYLKYRIKVEEFNKRFRETNLVLHVTKGFMVCSGNLKLFFLYYDFEKCQQTLYCHVHDNMRITTPEGDEKKLNDTSTIRLDKIMKRVNTLTKKYEWSYFEALTSQKLPPVDEKEHRKKGMCFCQYVLYGEQAELPLTMVEVVKDQVTSMKRNAFRKSHHRKERSLSYQAPISYKDSTAKFSSDSNNIVYI